MAGIGRRMNKRIKLELRRFDDDDEDFPITEDFGISIKNEFEEAVEAVGIKQEFEEIDVDLEEPPPPPPPPPPTEDLDQKWRKVVGKYRSKFLKMNYLDLTASLLEEDLLPRAKHKEFKATGKDCKDRIDMLLEWLEESAPPQAFLGLQKGLRNCGENLLAKKIRKEAMPAKCT